MTFHNTIKYEGTQLKIAQQNAEALGKAVYRAYCQQRELSPTECMHHVTHVQGKDCLIGSIRRAITDLTTEGKLIKTTKRIPSPRNGHEFVWIIAVI